jgi:hypothetical protein
VRFADFLKATVFTSAGSATALAALCLAGASARDDLNVVYFCAAWWLIAAMIGTTMGRRNETTPPIAKLMADARFQHALPEVSPGRALVNRLWPLLVATIAAGALVVLAPQIPGVAAGFAIIWALAWRRQDAAVTAVEERDGARFYVEKTSPFKAIRLVRTPGFKASVPRPEHTAAPS